MENIEQYQYEPLPQPNSIRFMRLHSGVGPAEFSCSLVVADISNPPEYIALSYVWGHPSHTVPILCDDFVFSDIKALFVGLQAIHYLGGTIRHFDETTGDLHWVGNGRCFVSALPPALVHPHQEELARLKRFFCRPYFSRTWVLQKVGLASCAVVRWSDLDIEWHPIDIITMFLMRHCRALLERLDLSTEVNKVYHLHTAYSPFVPQATLLHILDKARRLEATDSRDKNNRSISGAEYNLTLSKSTQGTALEADYSKHVEDVYRLLTLDHIRRTLSLEILNAVQHNPTFTSVTNFSCPTWVPRRDQFHDMPILGLYISKHIASANRDVIFNSSPSFPFTLTVRGTLLDTISCHTKVLCTRDSDLPLTTTTTPLTPDSEPVQRLGTSCPIARVWVSTGTTTADPNSYPQLGWPRMGSSLFAAYRTTWVADNNFTYGENGSWHRYRDSATYVCDKRKFFITSMRFFGIGPGALMTGDDVAVLLGADVPFALWRVLGAEHGEEEGEAQDGEGQKYALAGECCVRGLMQGQAIRAGLKQKDIVLI
ncbi:uncharacterized protein [Physcomitrium patens]|uniref:uncharacterized protein n=1 Tax=Physcomitrium patens TaxID=3218 RepID=UPI000D17BCF3|nr:uncharacterized protein LOC112292627 [Physcomitrium patens]|eukprot:XP_024397059.1 uncharacterized protein LOC112292627 [Physcomitrella patens]